MNLVAYSVRANPRHFAALDAWVERLPMTPDTAHAGKSMAFRQMLKCAIYVAEQETPLLGRIDRDRRTVFAGPLTRILRWRIDGPSLVLLRRWHKLSPLPCYRTNRVPSVISCARQAIEVSCLRAFPEFPDLPDAQTDRQG